MLSDLMFRLRSLFRRKAVETELNDELQFHVRQQADKYMRSGLTRDEALRRARIDFGGIDEVKEDCRQARGVHVLETLIRDIRYGLRLLRHAPAFTCAALLTLALGIGANTGIFSVVYSVLLRPLPYQDASRLVVLNETTPKVGDVSVSYPNFLDWRSGSRTFAQMSAVTNVSFALTGMERAEYINGLMVSPNFLSMLGLRPFLGRDFEPAEERTGARAVALLSYSLWQSHFGGDRTILGRSLTLDGRSFTVIGVLPPEFRWIQTVDILETAGAWAAANESAATNRGSRGDTIVLGRLAQGVSLQQADAEMRGIAARLAREYPAVNDQFGVALSPIRDSFVGDLRPAILILFGAVSFVLLIACANVANLFLMRGASRSREIALRMAIGAGRGRIVRQILAESLVLASLGGLLGLGLALAGIQGLSRMIPAYMLSGAQLDLNGAALLFAMGIVVLSTLLFGLAPALQSTRADLISDLKESGRSSSAGVAKSRMRDTLAIAEVALALLLLAGAGLMVKSLYRLLSVDPGFQPDGILTMQVSLPDRQYSKSAAILDFWQQFLGSVRAIPGVESAALGLVVPFTGEHSRSDITLEGMALPEPGSFPHPDVHVVSPEYVHALAAQLVRGRDFTDADNERAPRVAMINSLLARRYFPNQDAVGKRLMFGHPSAGKTPEWITIVGVVGDTKLYGLQNPARLEVYVPLRQNASGDMSLVVRSKTEATALTSAIRSALATIDKAQPIVGIATMNQLIRNSLSANRVVLVFLGLFGALALVMAAIGVYGVIAYSVAQRTHEIGIRMAMGARRTDMLRMIFSQGVRIGGIGGLIGIGVSFALTRWMASLLFSTSPNDPLIYFAVAGVIAVVVMLACYFPARRAMGVDPMVALRHE